MRLCVVACAWLVAAAAVPGGRASSDWWESANFYQVYTRSFQDSDGDGIGDLNGVTSRLEYFKEVGITAIWLSPIFQSPQVDFGYDISDYTRIHSEYGTLDDFDLLVAKCRRLDIKLILDFVPNHTSDQHEWFVRSAARDPDYDNFYVWHPGTVLANGTRTVPNNWLSDFRFSAWKWHDGRGEYYFHQFSDKQVDLNFREPRVIEAIKDIMRLWLGRGADGFRIDAIPFLFEVAPDELGNYPDEPLSGACDDPQGGCYLSHIYTQNIEETFDMVFQWRAVMDEYKAMYGGQTRVIMLEAYTSLENKIRMYGDGVQMGGEIPFNFELISHMTATSTATDYHNSINDWINMMPTGARANWVLGNHDNKRLSTRFGVERADLFNILLQTLPGVAVTYNGEELALTDVHISWENTLDPLACNTSPDTYETVSRDPVRTPFPWDDSPNAGFSTNASTWLPVASDFATIGVKHQRAQPFSHLKLFQILTSIRRTETMMEGGFESHVTGNNILTYTRSLTGGETYVVVLNLGTVTQTIDLTAIYPALPTQVEVIGTSLQSNYVSGDVTYSRSITAMGQVGTVFVAF